MKKFLLYALSLVCIAGVANAQQKSILLQPKQERKVHKVEALTNQAQKQKFERSNQHLSIITSENNLLSRADDLTWDYHLYNATSEDELSAVGAAGYKIRAAFEIDSATVAQLIGCKISQGYFGVGSNGRTSRFKPFIALGADELCDEPSLQLSSTKFTANAQTYVDFDFTIPDNSEYGPIYVGYEITNSESVGSTTYYPVLFDYYTYDYDPSMVLALWDTDEETGVEYWDAAYYGTYFGALWSGCIITGDLPTNEAELYLGMADPQAQVGDQVYITTYLYNSAANYINSVTYSTLVAEGTGALDLEELQSRAAATDEQTVTLDEPIAPLQGGYVTFIVPYTLDKVGSYTVALTVTALNGVNIEPQTTYSYINVAPTPQVGYPSKLVYEELTGTWCGWCPMGLYGMQYCKENYPDSFIGIAIHYDDEYSTTEADEDYVYNFLYLGWDGNFPYIFINRQFDFCPSSTSWEYAPYYMEVLKDYASVAQIKATAEIDGDYINVSTTTNFCVNGSEMTGDNAYALAFVITESGLEGYQTNYLPAYGYELPGWEEWDYSDYYLTATTYDDIARGGIVDFWGVLESLMTDVKTGQDYDYNITLDVPETVENLNNCHLVAMVVDAYFGNIINATEISLDPAAIRTVATEAAVAVSGEVGEIQFAGDYKQASVYDMSGRKVAQANGQSTLGMAPGFYLVRTLDKAGNARSTKVLVK